LKRGAGGSRPPAPHLLIDDRQRFAELIDIRAVGAYGGGECAEQNIIRLGGDPEFGKTAPPRPCGNEEKLMPTKANARPTAIGR
jgi:hypothetical protein